MHVQNGAVFCHLLHALQKDSVDMAQVPVVAMNLAGMKYGMKKTRKNSNLETVSRERYSYYYRSHASLNFVILHVNDQSCAGQF